MNDDISIELSVVVRYKVDGRVRSKFIRQFMLIGMDAEQYATARQQLMDSITALGQSYVDCGYTIEQM